MAFRLSSRLLSAAVVKKTTGITGLDVVPNAREVLVKLYEKTLKDVQIIPDTVPYRKAVEAFTGFRMNVVKENDDIAEIERVIGCGQVEQLIEQAKGELVLIPEYASWKAWEAKPASPEDEDFADFYEDLEFVDPDSVAYLGLKDLAAKKRAEAATARNTTASTSGDTSYARDYQARADIIAAAQAKKEAAAAAAAAAAAPKKA